MKIEKGFAIDKKVDAVINSANGLLIHDSSGAGRIRELSSEVDFELIEKISEELNPEVRSFFYDRAKEHNWVPKFANLTAIKLLLKKKEFKLGESIYDEELSKDLGKEIIHAITMSYDVMNKNSERIFGTEESVIGSYSSAIKTAIKLGCKSIAFPIPIARPGYGIGPEKSFLVIKGLCAKFKSKIDIVVCADNDVTLNYAVEKNFL